MKIIKFFLVASLLSPTFSSVKAEPSLKDAFQGDFLIGAAVNDSQFTERNATEAEIVKRQFNSITPENVLKWESVHPQLNHYRFESADRYVEFGLSNKMFVIGHNLIWHNQTPSWVFRDDEGNPLGREALLARMKDHISTVVGRYKGKINGWDVVNEALNEDGTMRKTSWMKIIGDDYLIHAYQFAHEADPKAQLYYNEFSMENEPKRKGAIALIKKLQAAGVPIAAVGMQGHYNLGWPSDEEVGQTIDELSALGVKVMITELDMDVLPRATRAFTAEVSEHAEARAELNPYKDGLPTAVQESLTKRYADLFRVFLKHKSQITRVTFWGVSDSGSWLNNWPVPNRTDYPLLFDRKDQPKPALDAIIAVAQEGK